jgi:hypothetical protein
VHDLIDERPQIGDVVLLEQPLDDAASAVVDHEPCDLRLEHRHNLVQAERQQLNESLHNVIAIRRTAQPDQVRLQSQEKLIDVPSCCVFNELLQNPATGLVVNDAMYVR